LYSVDVDGVKGCVRSSFGGSLREGKKLEVADLRDGDDSISACGGNQRG